MNIWRRVNVWSIRWNIGVNVTDLMFLSFYESTTSDVVNQVGDIITMDGDVLDDAKEVGVKAFECVIKLVCWGTVCVVAITVEIELNNLIVRDTADWAGGREGVRSVVCGTDETFKIRRVEKATI